ncbi:AraC family transcriptional regulator [Pseudoalteromonas piscicida]|uniref:AraC family transcriptional regulator n=2 Tax=Pseudoalteromonas piscicida TaxID=43662 RepID=A0AAD0W6F3_PSEO7|nr:helix-turn-helix transcriptional regulator [Pseudoalteromonas piscicida]ASD68846.1 AraC family transcriptional regulator [Pseudoalteromonas piscicida]AXQ99597.1 AraC family transcriptional regulator [Pseudoalteromonas piscicida]AXR03903.1 AraC family transcriptional regulator [Pseudoalteromonas piscicida]
MPSSSSKQTTFPWRIQPKYKRFLKPTLGRPILPRAVKKAEWEHVQQHQHEWGQLAYTSNGVITIVTPEGTFVIPPDQALWLPPNLPHETYCRYGGDFRSVYIDNKYTELLGNKAKLIAVDELLKQFILEICTWQEDYHLDDKTERFIDVFIDRLTSAATCHFFIPSAQDARILPIVTELHTNPGCKISLETWSEQVGASTRTLNRLFHKCFMMGFSDWRQKLRAIKAIELLKDGYSQQQAAEYLGFESTAAFSNAFKKVFGKPPGQYLKK